MPIIQQENGRRSVKGLPLRWGVKAYKELTDVIPFPERYNALAALLDSVTGAAMPLDVTDAQIVLKAEKLAAECQAEADRGGRLSFEYTNAETGEVFQGKAMDALGRIAAIFKREALTLPECEKPEQAIARAVDPAYWRRQLRKTHGRIFEAAAIRLGFVSSRSGIYASDETVTRRMDQRKRNEKILSGVKLENEFKQQFSLQELADKGTANKSNRRNELMLRLAGFEDVAIEAGHPGVFATLTCPSRFHAVLQGSGRTNPNYDGSTPRQAQAYLCKVWARIRAKLARSGIAVYGFRIAEPHHDACPHWHALLFIQPGPGMSVTFARSRFERICKRYGWADSRGEPGAFSQRLKFEDIDAAKGSAAAYIAKYISKNIDDSHVKEHTDGELVLEASNRNPLAGRVDAWAAAWGIRQFQQIGGAPVTVWRELRRVKEEMLRRCMDPVLLQAWKAAQRIEFGATDPETGEAMPAKRADFAEYLRAQGGAVVGRAYRIRVEMRECEIQGRYGLEKGKKPVGVFNIENQNALYESTRYQWSKVSGAAGFGFSWTRVNNCTPEGGQYWNRYQTECEIVAAWDESEYFAALYDAGGLPTNEEIMQEIQAAQIDADQTRANTVFTAARVKRTGAKKRPEYDF